MPFPSDTTPDTRLFDLIDHVPARARCAQCAEDFEVESGWIFTCPRCSRLSGELVQGRELELSRIEMT